MAYTSWNKELLNKQYQVINSIYNNSKDTSYLVDIQVLESLITDNIICFGKEENPILQLNDNISSFDAYSDFINPIEKFAKTSLGIPNKQIPPLNTFNQDTDIILEFVHDFYNNLPPIFKDQFNKVFKERKNNLRFSDKRSVSNFIPHLKYSYINIETEGTIADFLNTIHEYAHSIVDLLNYRSDYYAYYPFIELVPLLFEIIACEFLEEEFTNISGETIIYRAYEFDRVNNYSKQLILEGKFYASIRDLDDLRKAPRRLAAINKISIFEAKKILSVSSLEKFSYTIPFMTAVELFYLYKFDKELCFYYLNKIIYMHASENYSHELDKMNINLNEHMKLYTEELNRQLKKVS